METLWCSGLAVEQVPNPTLDRVLGHMRQEYEAWGWADPMLGLFWYDHLPQPVPSRIGLGQDKLVCQLLVIRHPDRGFFCEYSLYRGVRRWLVAIDPAGNRDEWVEHMANGEETFFLAACFTPQAAGERVVEHFMSKREPSPTVEWVPFQPLWPRRNEPPE